MTAPTTHDTRTVILTDAEMYDEAQRVADAQEKDEYNGAHYQFRDGFVTGGGFARSIYEPHVAKLEAEIADHKAAFGTMSARYREQLTAAELEIAALKAMVPVWVPFDEWESKRFNKRWLHCGWDRVTTSRANDEYVVLLSPPIPLPAAPTQGGGE